MRWLVGLVLIVLAAAATWWTAGRQPGPEIQIRQPDKFIGQSSPVELSVDAPNGRLTRLDVTLEQGTQQFAVFTLGQAGQTDGAFRRDANGRAVVTARVGKQALPALQAGAARIVVRASRPVLYGLRQVSSQATRDLQVRLDPPRVSVESTFHYVNHGGAEFVVYRATPPDVESGVRVGDLTYPGFPGTAVGIKAGDGTHVAFFALLHEQAANVPITVYARDGAGNEAVAAMDHRVFPKPFARSRIEIDDRFLQRVVPAIASGTPDLKLSTAPGDLLESFLRINGDLRQRNSQTLLDLSKKSAPRMLWTENFQPLGNAKVEAKFADSRTYLYQRKEVDHQVHLGFDLAVTQHIPVVAANRGLVVYAGDLGIYGNCVVLDHGLGVQSLYGHLSSIDVKVGDRVDKGVVMGRSGMTGLAAGDHLHFTILVDGHPVNPVEWWDRKWMQDRVFRKISEAGGTVERR